MKKKLASKCFIARSFFLLFVLFGFHANLTAQTFYYNGTGDLNNVASWGANANGTGTAPADFTTNNQVFIIQNGTSITHNSGVFAVAGTNSKIVMGNPTYASPATPSPAITITINAGSQITTAGNVNFEVSLPSSGNHKIIYKNTSAISFSTVMNDPNLELVFDGNTLTTTTNRTFGNVSIINNANITMAGASIVLNNLLVEEGSTLAGPLDASGNYIAIKTGGSVTINGTLRAGRQGSVTSPNVGGLYSTGIALPVVAASSQATLLFQSATTPPALTLGANSTVDYYRGFGATQTGVQGITPWAYANLILSNDATASNRSFSAAGNITVAKNFIVRLRSTASITQPSTSTNVRLLPTAKMMIDSANIFPTNGRLTLQSDLSGTASIGALASGASITGNVTVQQFISAGARSFRFLSHPFNSNQKLSQLVDNIDITGNAAGTIGQLGQTAVVGFTATSTNNPSAFLFNTSSANGNVTNDGGWTAINDTSTANWNVARGIRVLVRGTKSQAGTLNGTNNNPSALTLDMSGVINQGQVVTNLAIGGTGATEGFNLVGNPYPSPVNIGAVLNAATNIGNTIYLRNPITSSYITINPIPPSYIIPANAAFFVKANASTSLTFNESNKVNCTSCATVFKSAIPNNRFEMQFEKDGEVYDNLIVNFTNNPSISQNKNEAVKLMNSTLNVYAVSSNNKRLAATTSSLKTSKIRLGILLPKTADAQTFNLRITDFNLNFKGSLVLHDKLNNSFTPINETTVYQLQINPLNPESVGENRLEIIVKN